MRLIEIMTPSVEIVHPDVAVGEAAARLKTLDRNLLPVGDGERVVGLLVGQDIEERVLAMGRDPQTTPVSEVMLTDVVYAYGDQDVTEAARLMRDRKLPELIVLTRDNRLAGLVTLADLALPDDAGPDEVLAHEPESVDWTKPVYRRILVALDGSHLAEHVLPHVMVLAEKFGATITLLWVIPPPEMLAAPAPGPVPLPGAPTGPIVDPQTLAETERLEGQVYLTTLAERLRAQGLTVTGEQPEGPPAAAIVETARQQGTDLIAMTSHGRGGLGRLDFGSVADVVLRGAPCPLLLVPVGTDS